MCEAESSLTNAIIGTHQGQGQPSCSRRARSLTARPSGRARCCCRRRHNQRRGTTTCLYRTARSANHNRSGDRCLASKEGGAAQAPRRWSQVRGCHPQESVRQDYAKGPERPGKARGRRCAGEREQAIRGRNSCCYANKTLDGRRDFSQVCA